VTQPIRRARGEPRSGDGSHARTASRAVAVGAAIVAACAAAAAIVASRGSGPARPNVLLLVMDTTRGDRCSIDGYPRPTTPRLEEFAKDATVFRDAWSPANWTAPAHASLFTGLRVEHHGMHRGNRRYLADGIGTLAERLAADGYSTACFSNNSVVSQEFGLTQGFRTLVPLFDRHDLPYPWAHTTHDEAALWARSEARAGRPFFLFINDMEPHIPYTPVPEMAARFVRGAPTQTQTAAASAYEYPHTLGYSLHVEEMPDAERELLSDLYDAEIATLDAEIGVLLDQFRADGLLDSTLVVVAGDHGENLGEHHLWEHSLGLHRTLLHVPLVVRYPGRFDKGRVVGDVVRLEDVYPTVLETCGIPVPAGLDGVSLTRDLPGRIARAVQFPQDERRDGIEKLFGPVPALTPLLRGVESAYDGRFHFLRYSDGAEELFDVGQDPDETRDLHGERPDVAARLRGLLAPAPDAPPAPEGSRSR
jgi:arylsulfatase A-like enzyme